jgi:hypothetical protein
VSALNGRNGGKWRDLGNGIRQSVPTQAAAAFHRQQEREKRAMQRRVEANTCGLGRWEQPEDWNRLAYSHTVTHVDANSDHWLPYVTGCTVALDVHPIEGPFTRGAAYVWCKRIRENGNVMFPTAPLFGRFIELAGGRPKVLAGEGRSELVGADYVYCFRAVGVLHGERQFFPRSEVPVPIPSEAERINGPDAFDVLQHAAKRLDELITNLCDVTDMADELTKAEKKATGELTLDARRNIEARAYRSLQPIINAATAQSGQVETGLADYLKTSPSLAYWLKRWQG